MADKKKVLLVDDSELVAGMLTSVLEEAGYEVHRAKNGVEGVEKTYKIVPDLIIMDVEMPLMQGYQASRLLKHRRGVKDIPIIMHTSLSEDRDKYWALSSGADAFANKDFDNLERLLDQVQYLIDHGPYDQKVIAEDAEGMDQNKIFEMMGTLFDKQLFQSTMLNILGEVGRSIGSLSITAVKILELLTKVCDVHVSVMLVKDQNNAAAYIWPGDDVFQQDVDDFYEVCLGDFYSHFPHLDLDSAKKQIFNISDRDNFDKVRLDKKKISSYTVVELKGKGGTIFGTLHVGNFSNNYFSDTINDNIHVFADGAGIILENSLLFTQVNVMQDKIKNVFAKFVPQEIISDLIEKQSDEDLMVGEKREVVVLFSDIRSFTQISENNTAESVVSFLNTYFNRMVTAIKSEGGTIDKFIGDAILAIFGAPKSYEDNAARAVRAARKMIETLPEISTDGLTLPEEGFNIGIGIHEGNAIVGNIGSSDKFDYTVIGDTVNLASRLEGLTKLYKKYVILSEEVKTKVEKEVPLREVDRVKVKGKAKATSIFTVENDERLFSEDFLSVYRDGLKLYKMGNWNTAEEYFITALKKVPEDYISKMFIKRCRDFKEKPPANWDGAITLTSK